jgi:WS/DGAT/MGAT family acyltransferase
MCQHAGMAHTTAPTAAAPERMSDAEGLMWRLDKDPYLSSTFANVTILDRPPELDRLKRRMERATLAYRRLRQRVAPAPANVAAPMWVDDPEFDIDYHVRRIAVPRPGSLRQLLDLATLITADPFDRTRPMWQFVVVEGLRGGKASLIEKLHHTIADGEGSVKLSLEFLDFARDAPEPPPLALPDVEQVPEHDYGASAPEALREVVAGSMRVPLALVRQLRELVTDPTQIPGAGTAAASTLRAIVSQLSDVEPARSPLWTKRSLRRHLDVARASFHDTKDAAKRLGGTLNTAFLTAAAEAASRYHVKLGAPVESLRASMAISTRATESGANAFTLARMVVPTGEMPIDERFRAIQEIADAAREQAGGATLSSLATMTAALPTSLLTRLVRQQSQTVDFATSNVRGAPMPLYVAGAQVLENYPVGPLAGVAMNVTLLSYLGSLDMGINMDAAAVERPELLSRLLQQSLRDLAAV